MEKVIYFEDLFVGRRFVSEPEEVTEEAIVAFARENDPQYFHLDPHAARDSMFGGIVASGWQTASATVRHLLYRCGVTFPGGLIGVDTQISWKRPVRPGDHLHIQGEITKLRVSRSLPDRGLVTFDGGACDGAGRTVQTLVATMLVSRDPKRAEGPDTVSSAP
jgi:acyl dehydratase